MYWDPLVPSLNDNEQSDCKTQSEHILSTLKDGNFKHQEIWLAISLNIVTGCLFIVTVVYVSCKWRNQMFLMLTPWFIMTSAVVNLKNATGYH